MGKVILYKSSPILEDDSGDNSVWEDDSVKDNGSIWGDSLWEGVILYDRH